MLVQRRWNRVKKAIKIIITVLIAVVVICCGLKIYGTVIVKSDGNSSSRESATYESWSGNCIFFSDYHTLYAYSVTRDRKIPMAFNIWGIADDIQVLGDKVYYLTYDWKGELSIFYSCNMKKPFASKTEYDWEEEKCITEEYIYRADYMCDYDRIVRVDKNTNKKKEVFRMETEDSEFFIAGISREILYVYQCEENKLYAVDLNSYEDIKKYNMGELSLDYVYEYDSHTYFVDKNTGYLYEVGDTLERKYKVCELSKDDMSGLMSIKNGKLLCFSVQGSIFATDMEDRNCVKIADFGDYISDDEEWDNVSWCDDYIVVSVKNEEGEYLRLLVFDYSGKMIRDRTEKM